MFYQAKRNRICRIGFAGRINRMIIVILPILPLKAILQILYFLSKGLACEASQSVMLRFWCFFFGWIRVSPFGMEVSVAEGLAPFFSYMGAQSIS